MCLRIARGGEQREGERTSFQLLSVFWWLFNWDFWTSRDSVLQHSPNVAVEATKAAAPRWSDALGWVDTVSHAIATSFTQCMLVDPRFISDIKLLLATYRGRHNDSH